MNKIKFLRSKLKSFSDIYNGNSIPDDKKDSFVNKRIPYIATKNIDADTHQIDYENGLSVNEDDGFRIAKTKSSLLCIEGGSAGKKLGYLNQEVAFVNKLCCFTPKNIDSKFLFYSLQSSDFLSEFSLHLTGMIGGVKIGEIKNLYISHPDDLGEQHKIACFLDRKIGQIDNLISNQEKQIEKLKEYKQAIITKAVTKGLDPNVPMKDSGIEWIGKIPCTWQVKRIKDFLEKDDFGIKCGPFGSALTGKVISDGEYNIYGQWNVIGNDFSIRRNTIEKKDYLNLISYSVRPKDILVSMMGSIGRCALVPEKIHPGIMDSHIIKIRLNFNEMNPYFFLYEYDKNNSTIISEFYNRAKKGFIMDGLNTSIIKNATFVSPPIDIQKKVVDYLDSFCSKVDAVISFKESKIQKLQIYKKSLIYEYVTGKKRVSL